MIQRERYMQRIRPFIDGELIKVLTGIRRSGKSVMLELIQEELRARGIPETQFITLNFESLQNAAYCTATALYAELSQRIAGRQGRVYLFLDEIQEVANWEKCINSCRVDFDCDIYITGSNATLLSGELATYLGGRYTEFVIYPFSFEEFCESRRRRGDPDDPPAAFSAYVTHGGMPFLSNFQSDAVSAQQYLCDIYRSVVLKDIVSRHHIRDVDLLERIITYVMANIGHTFSARSISNYFKSERRRVAPETILNYLRACCDAYLFYRLNREEVASKKLLSINEKYYTVDHGIRAAVYGKNTENIEQVLENIVCIELLRRGYSVTIGKIGDLEIDFIGEKHGARIYIQVAYLLPTPETAAREFGVYEGIRDNYPKYVVSIDEFDLSRDGIRHRNIRDFLLAEAWDV